MIPPYRAKKSLGQNFLTDPNYKRKILDAVLAGGRRPVLEIGGGKGILTEELAAQAPHLCVVEKDHHLAELLRERFSPQKKVTILCEDFLKLDLDSIMNSTVHGSTILRQAQDDGSPCPHPDTLPDPDTLSLSKGEKPNGRILVVGNLPYNIASQIFIRLIENRNLFSELFLMFQKEMALRFVAKPRTKDYGLLTLWAQIFTEPKILFHLPPTVFFPRPKVSSSFVYFKIKEAPLISDEEGPRFWNTMRTLFQKRRKTIRSALHKSHSEAAGKWSSHRVGELSVAELISLSRSLRNPS